jgi:glycosyltransferase involved in cell wall biosynthesis
MSFFNRLYSDLLFDRSIMQADILLAISNYTAHAIKTRYAGRRSEKLVIGCSVDRSLFKPLHLSPSDRTAIAQKYGTVAPFLLFVGTLEPRKNLDFMLQLMPQLAANGLRLVVVGASGWGKSKVASIVKQAGYPFHMITFAGYVPTADLVKLYNTASIYVSTALNEGFGLPQLEAMNCGCPVVSPHNSAMIELVEGAGITVKGWDIDAWCGTILDAYNGRDQYISSGYKRAETYNWPQIAAEIIKRISDNEVISR